MKHAFLGIIAALTAALCLLPAGALAANPETLTAELEPAAEPAVFEGEEAESNDALFSNYVLRRFYGQDAVPASAGDPARNRLNRSERTLYDLLKPKLAAVAENGGATRFSFSLEELGVKTRWTEEELKQEGLSVPGGELSGTLSQILQREFPADGKAVRGALLADLPFELYWFDKTAAAAGGFSGNYTSTGSDLDLSGLRFAFDFPVAEGYRDASGESGGLYTVKSDVSAVKTAVEDAQTIIDQFRGQDDYTKLLGYRSEICDRVSYHKEAAGGSAYGNPWQAVYVFDGDPATNVVCEGYAKAFQYLCDLTDFDGEVDCYTVSGLMEGADSAGPHMWNIVRFGGLGGRSYLVDVTNSDEGSVGADGGLFLAGARVYDQTTPPGYVISLPRGEETVEIKYWYSSDPLLGPDGNPLYQFDHNEADLWGNLILTLAEENYNPSEAAPPAVTQSAIGGVKVEGKTLTLSAAAAEKAHLLAAAYDRNRRFLDTVLLKSLEPGETYEGSLGVPPEAVYFQAVLTGGESGSPLYPSCEAI